MQSEHALLVRIPLSNNELGTEKDDVCIDLIEEAIRHELEQCPEVGRWDGHEFGGGWAVIFCYGDKPLALQRAVTSALLAVDLPPGSSMSLDSAANPVVLRAAALFDC